MSKDKETITEYALLTKIKEQLEKNEPVRKMEFTEEESKIIILFSLPLLIHLILILLLHLL